MPLSHSWRTPGSRRLVQLCLLYTADCENIKGRFNGCRMYLYIVCCIGALCDTARASPRFSYISEKSIAYPPCTKPPPMWWIRSSHWLDLPFRIPVPLASPCTYLVFLDEIFFPGACCHSLMTDHVNLPRVAIPTMLHNTILHQTKTYCTKPLIPPEGSQTCVIPAPVPLFVVICWRGEQKGTNSLSSSHKEQIAHARRSSLRASCNNAPAISQDLVACP